jgi:predicted ester cyclase
LPTPEENKAVARRAWETYTAGDVDGFAACLTEDWVEHDPDGENASLADNVEVMNLHREAFPDKRPDILHEVAEGDLVAQHIVVTATQTGQYFDLAPSGRGVRVVEMMVHRMRDGRIAETWALTVGNGFYEQLTGRSGPPSNENMA